MLQFHHRKELMEQIRTGEYVPYTFHMCWTQTKADKLQVGATRRPALPTYLPTFKLARG